MKQNKTFLATLTILTGLVSPRALAMPLEYQVNVREGCRQAIAGAYLKAYDDKERSASYEASLKEQITALKGALADAKAKAEGAAKAAAGHDFDVKLAAARDDTAVVVRTLTAQMGDYQAMLAKNAPRIKSAVAHEQQLRAQIDVVFQFTRTGDLKDGGYPTHLSYRASCPKYRALCPLPSKDREALASIKIDGALPEVCQKYPRQGRFGG